jgi:hypothetical protein
MAPETTQIEHARGVSRINHQDRLPAQTIDFAELIARIRALGRRAAAPLPPSLERRRCIARIPPTVVLRSM